MYASIYYPVIRNFKIKKVGAIQLSLIALILGFSKAELTHADSLMPPGLVWSYPLGSTQMLPAGLHPSAMAAAQHQCESYEEYYTRWNSRRPPGYQFILTHCSIIEGPNLSGSTWQARIRFDLDVYSQGEYLRSHSYTHHHVRAGSGCSEPLEYSVSNDRCEIACPADRPFDPVLRDCAPPPKDCNVTSNPINFLTGTKYKVQSDYTGGGGFPLKIVRYYNSLENKQRTSNGLQFDQIPEAASAVDTLVYSEPRVSDWTQLRRFHAPIYNFDHLNDTVYTGRVSSKWRHYYDRFLLASFSWAQASASDIPEIIRRYPPNGEVEVYRYDANEKTYRAENNYRSYIERIVDNHELSPGWRVATQGGEVEYYSLQGKLLRLEATSGGAHDLIYDPVNKNRLLQVIGPQGQSLTYEYENEADPSLVSSIATPGGATFRYRYNGRGMLTEVVYPNLTPTDRQDSASQIYHYEDEHFPDALTGITDESGRRRQTYAYDDQGRAVLSELADGAERTTVEYDDLNKSRTLTNALGKQTTFYLDPNGSQMITRVEGHPSDNCAGSFIARTHNESGELMESIDRQGNTTVYERDRIGREISRTEAAGTPDARTITTEYHPTLNKPGKITEPGKVTTMTYDAEGRLISNTTQSTTAP